MADLWKWLGLRRDTGVPVKADMPPIVPPAQVPPFTRIGGALSPFEALPKESTSGRITDPDGPAPDPAPLRPGSAQHTGYWVLSDAELAKGWVRPYRDAYRHVGIRPQYPTRALTEDEHERYDRYGYVAFEAYPDGGSVTGRFWTAPELVSGCGAVTTMGHKLSATYAREPAFYGATFCCQCNRHLPVQQFVWALDGEVVGS